MSVFFNKTFKLNGESFDSEGELLQYSKDNLPEVFGFFEELFSKKDNVEIQTSGSTGIPKKIAIRKRYLLNSAKATASYFKLGKKTTALLCLSTDYIAGKMMLVRALVHGWHIDIVEPSAQPLKNRNKNYDFCAMIPLQVRQSIDDLHKIKILIIGGGAVSGTLQQKLQSLLTQCYATYGMTETVSHVALKKLNHGQQDSFKALPYVSFSTDQRNCLVIDALFLAETILFTNDIVKLVSKREFEWLGRYDSIINSGGIKLIPEQIEKKLEHMLPNRFFVCGLPDETLGEKLVLLVEGNSSGDVIQSKVKNLDTLQKYEIPKAVFTLEKFVETETGKIQREKTLELVSKS